MGVAVAARQKLAEVVAKGVWNDECDRAAVDLSKLMNEVGFTRAEIIGELTKLGLSRDGATGICRDAAIGTAVPAVSLSPPEMRQAFLSQQVFEPPISGPPKPLGLRTWLVWLAGIALIGANLGCVGAFLLLKRAGPESGSMLLQEVVWLSRLLFIVPLLVWQYGAYCNLCHLIPTPRFSPGWAVAYWFVPVVNLWYPCVAMKEIWRASSPDSSRGAGLHHDAGVVTWWWYIWLGTWVLHIAGQTWGTLYIGMLIALALTQIVFWVLTMFIVGKVSGWQRALAASKSDQQVGQRNQTPQA